MKKYINIFRIVIPLMFLLSCDWPKTVVTNYVHPDGSVTRRVVMKNKKDTVDPDNYRVPVDSTWTFSKTFEISNLDTIWIITAEKHFSSVEEINRDYESDQGINKNLRRQASFKKKFEWFNTRYIFTEKISKILNIEIKANEYFNKNNLEWFYMPESEIDSLLKSADSLRYKAHDAIVDSIAERYLLEALINEWAQNYLKIVPDSEYIHAKKDLLIDVGIENDNQDSVFMTVLGEEYYSRNKAAIDTSLARLDSIFTKIISVKLYTMETVMPGKLVSSNGFKHKDGRVSWAVDSKYFVSQDYIMQAESMTVNSWAWVATGLIVLFLLFLSLRYLFKNKL